MWTTGETGSFCFHYMDNFISCQKTDMISPYEGNIEIAVTIKYFELIW